MICRHHVRLDVVGVSYPAVVMDAFSQRVVAWTIVNHLRTELVLEALNMAIWHRRPESVIHYSDQGTQYTSIAFGHRYKQPGVRPSTRSARDRCDNAMAETFFATLETEWFWRHSFKSYVEARMAVFEFLEGFYSPRRRHSALDHQSPATWKPLRGSHRFPPHYCYDLKSKRSTVHRSGVAPSQGQFAA